MVSRDVLTSGYLCCLRCEHTRQVYGRVLTLLVDYIPENLADCRSEHFEQYLMTLKLSNSTKNLHIAVIKSAFRWISENYNIPDYSRRIRRFPALPPKQRIISPEEFRLLCEKCPKNILDTLIFLAFTGLRVSEFCSITSENIGQDFLTVVGKGGKERRIPLNKTLKSLLNEHIIKFSKSRCTIWLLCQKAASLAGIPHFSPHSLRHYFATQLHKSKISTTDIAKVLGHKNSTVTETVYFHWGDEDLRGLTDCLD